MAKLVWRGPVVSAEVKRAAAHGLFLAAEHVLTEATKTIPIEEGTMARDGKTDVDPDALVAVVHYDGPSNPYVIRQHEDLSLRHDSGRRAKWLELTVQEEMGAIRAIVEREIRKVLA